MALMKVRIFNFVLKFNFLILEQTKLISKLQAEGLIKKIPKLENCWLAKTDPKDVARVESKTVICTESENETIPTPADGVEGKYLSYEPFQGYLMVSGCERFLAPQLEDSLKNGGVSDYAESADINFTPGHEFSSRPLRILSEY